MGSNSFYGGSVKVLYSEKDHDRVPNLFHLQIFLMKLAGQVPINVERYVSKRWQTPAKLLARLYCTFSCALTLHMALLYIKTTYDTLQTAELTAITDALTNAVIYSYANFATVYWLCRVKFVRSFIAEINEEYRHHSMAGLTFVSAYPSYRLAYKITLYWLRCCITGGFLWTLSPLLLGSHTLPLKCWYPFNPLQPGVYELIYASQICCQLLMGCIYGSCSALFVSVIVIMMGQFDILYCSLKNLHHHAQLMSGDNLKYLKKLQSELLKGDEDEVNQYVYSKEHFTDLKVFKANVTRQNQLFQKVLHKSLVECVLFHQFILKSCDKLEDLFNPNCLIKSLQTSLQLCLLVFIGVMGEKTALTIFNLIQYSALTLMELFIYTYFGELLQTHSVRADEAFFRSQWWPHAHYIKQDVLIFLVNTKRVVTLTTGKFYRLDIQRLRSVIAQSFSFLTLLQTLVEKNN